MTRLTAGADAAQGIFRNLFYWAAGSALALMMVLLVVNVMGRWLLSRSLVTGVEQLSRYLMAAVVYLGLAKSLHDGTFIHVETLTQRMGARTRRVVNTITNIMSFAACFALTWWSWLEAMNAYHLGTMPVDVLRIPMYVPRGIVAVGLTGLTAQFAIEMVGQRAPGDIQSTIRISPLGSQPAEESLPDGSARPEDDISD